MAPEPDSEARAPDGAALRRTIALLDRLTALMLADAPVAHFAQVMADHLGGAVTVFDDDLSVLATSLPGPDSCSGASIGTPVDACTAGGLEDPRMRQALETVGVRRMPLTVPASAEAPAPLPRVIAPIGAADELLGYLVLAMPADRAQEDLAVLGLQQAAALCALTLLRARREAELHARYKAELVDAILLGSCTTDKLPGMALLAGLIPDATYTVLAVAPRPIQPASIAPSPAGISRLLDGAAPGVVAVPTDASVVVLLPTIPWSGDPDGSADVGQKPSCSHEDIRALLSERYPHCRFAIGASAGSTDIARLPLAREQAHRALSLVNASSGGDIASYDELGIHRLLLAVSADELQRFADDVLGALTAYDAEHGSSLVDTLDTYLQAGENLRQTARALFVHTNTAGYRIRRIEDISGLHLGEPADRLSARVALAIRAVHCP